MGNKKNGRNDHVFEDLLVAAPERALDEEKRRAGGSRVSREEAVRIRERFQEGAKIQDLAREFKHDARVIERCVRGTHCSLQDGKAKSVPSAASPPGAREFKQPAAFVDLREPGSSVDGLYLKLEERQFSWGAGWVLYLLDERLRRPQRVFAGSHLQELLVANERLVYRGARLRITRVGDEPAGKFRRPTYSIVNLDPEPPAEADKDPTVRATAEEREDLDRLIADVEAIRRGP